MKRILVSRLFISFRFLFPDAEIKFYNHKQAICKNKKGNIMKYSHLQK